MCYNVKLCVFFSFEEFLDDVGILVCVEEMIVEFKVVLGVVYSCDEVKVIFVIIEDCFGIVVLIFGFLVEVGINVDMIVQNVFEGGKDGDVMDMIFLCLIDQLQCVEIVLNEVK